MKKIITLSIVGLTSLLNAQTNSVFLDENNVVVSLKNQGSFFNDLENGTPGYEVPAQSGIHALYNAIVYYGGVDINSQIHLSVGESILGTDVFRGPFSSTNAYNDSTYQADWGQSIWKVCQYEIDKFRIWWECQHFGASGNELATEESCSDPNLNLTNDELLHITNWPGNGNLALGMSETLAPFFDRDQDGIYDPLNDGDYPIIKGCCAVYMIQNDVAGIHTQSNTSPVGLEMHYLFYQYQNSGYLNNTTFLDVLAINKGTNSFNDFRNGIYVDGDLGCFGDDFIGCSPEKNMLFFYNGDAMDENSNGNQGYGENPPAIGIVSLKNTINSVVIEDGQTAGQYWNVFNGAHPNGSPINDPNNQVTTFVYSGNPAISNEWSEVSQSNPQGDRRGYMTGESINFAPGDSIVNSYAFIFSQDSSNISSVTQLYSIADSVQNFYANETGIGCYGNANLGIKKLTQAIFNIYPNPSPGVFAISGEAKNIKNISLFSVSGTKIAFEQITNGSIIEIKTSGLESGIYLITIETLQGSSTQKIIIE